MYEKLHLGCGPKHLDGYFHIDALDYAHVDHIGPVDDLGFIKDAQVEHIYACHLLEHFGRTKHAKVLREWRRVLKPGGTLRIAVPDFEACAKLYVAGKLDNGLETIRGLLMGGQKDEYDYHYVAFDKATLSRTLLDVGFSSVSEWDWRTTDHADMDDYSQAYLPHMDKENGVLVSLNLEATA